MKGPRGDRRNAGAATGGGFLVRPGIAARLAVVLTAAITACTVPEATVIGPEGRLPILGPNPWFSLEIMPRDWFVEGAAGKAGSQLSIMQKQSIPSLRVVNGREGFLVARRTNAFMLATPFLSWSWNMDPQGRGLHPVRLVVGFHGGNPESRSRGGQPFVWLGSELPPYDRLLAIAWGESALQRGNFVVAGKDLPAPPRPELHARYIARGGRENARLWWLETVDLSRFYAAAWPDDGMERVKVVFIGIAAAGGRAASAAYFSGIVLSR